MNCLEAREQFPAVVAGMIGLSEWAPVEAHVGKCADCRKRLEKLHRMKPQNEPGWARASSRPAEPSDESTSILEVVSPSRRLRRPALWAALAGLVVILGTGAWLTAQGSRPGFESTLGALLDRARSGARQAEVPTTPAPPLAEAPPQTDAPEVTAPPAPPPPASAPEPKTAAARAVPARPSASLPAKVTKPPRTAPASAAPVTRPGPEPATDPSALVEAGKIDVAVQISVRNRKDAERDLGALLARVGGTKLGRGQTATMIATVPRSSYSEFTRGLTQIGAWQLEAGRSSLPDPIHIAVKLAK